MCKLINEMPFVDFEPALLLQYLFFVFDPTIDLLMVYSLSSLNMIFVIMILQLQPKLRSRSTSSVICFPSGSFYLRTLSDVYHSFWSRVPVDGLADILMEKTWVFE